MDVKLKKLAIDVAKGQPVGNFSYDDMHETFRKNVAELVCNDEGKVDYYSWKENSPKVFALIGTMIDAILPPRVMETVGRFAEVKSFGHGDKPRFYIKKGRKNVRRFVTRVAAAGNYERVRLDRDYMDMEMYAHGGAVYQTLEGFLAGRENITEVFDILLEGLEDELYQDIAVALYGTKETMPAKNVATMSEFVDQKVKDVLATVRVYGTPTIFCTPEWAATIQPSADFVADADRNDMRNQGYIGRYNGADVVLLPQSFTDETNTEYVMDPSIAFVMPSGATQKPVMVGMEGNTLVREMEREDWSTEIQIYRKLGIAITHTNHYGIIENTSLMA